VTERSPLSTAGPTRIVNRIDLVLWAVKPENIVRWLEEFRRLYSIAFIEPTVHEETGVVAYLSAESGIELLMPSREDSYLAEHLREHGEGFYAIVFGVDDLARARARAQALGYPVGESFGPSGSEPKAFSEKIKSLEEAYIGDMLNTRILFGRIEYAPGVLDIR